MNVFDAHSRIVQDYATYIRSFLNIADPTIRSTVEQELGRGKLWPEPLLQFNPAYETAGGVDALVAAGEIHPAIADIFRGYRLYRHQVEAMRLGMRGRDFVVTSGTGSGKSLTYIGAIFQHLLANPGASGVSAVVVYPMNALINSQTEEFKRYQQNYQSATGQDFPISFGQYTGQEKDDARQRMRQSPPQVLLTNYMMLELLLTRLRERSIRDAIYANLRYLVFDELHTYRGRQGADVAMLIRRIRACCAHDLVCIGTSATMVSASSNAAQREQVAATASTLFGRRFEAEQVVPETLTRSLTTDGSRPTAAALAAAIAAGVHVNAPAAVMQQHPVAIWLENEVALDDRGGELLRRKPQRVSEVVASLARDARTDEETCRRFLADMLQWISVANERLQAAGQRYTVLPYKLHQFISQTGSVYTTLDAGDSRFITLEPGVFKVDEAGKKPIFPNVFSRASGHAFLCVTLADKRLEPREFRDSSDGDEVGAPDNVTDGYLIAGEEVWNPAEDMELLPESWLRPTKAGLAPRSEKKRFFPRKLYFDEFGNCSETPAGDPSLPYWGWFMAAPLLFDPTAGVFFDTKTNEGTKLTKLGSEGRSTSTTITAFSVIRRLAEAGYRARDQKLLSFTDNRQDAALQAGHFNDFIQVVQLRAAIYKALVAAPGNRLTFAGLGEAIFGALNLPFLAYANMSVDSPLASVRRKYERAMQDFLFYRAVADLRRSWRIVLPNLEQCALLAVDYADLDEAAAADPFWADLPLLDRLSPAQRQELLATILDFFRLEYAIDGDMLSTVKVRENARLFREQLRPPWTLDANEELGEPAVGRLEPLHPKSHLRSASMGPTSALGKYLKLYVRQGRHDVDLRQDKYGEFLGKLLRKLEEADYLRSTPARNQGNAEMPVYRLRLDRIIWRLGDKQTVKADVVKRRSYKDQVQQPNAFFQALYQLDFAELKRLQAGDHTGQLDVEARRDREDRFRADWWLDAGKQQPDEGRIRSESLSALFCSPTMELGIDIGGLSVVHLRNAPPNPANYAQRSGRAGRSGQGALIFTYCSSYSPHDRHYFQHQSDLVAGVVLAPRLDLYNEELLATHLNALAISEAGMSGLEDQADRRPSLMRFVEDDNDKLPLRAEVRLGLQLSAETRQQLSELFRRAIRDLEPALAEKAPWYTAEWSARQLGTLAEQLDNSLGRWRQLYRSARIILNRATQALDSGVLIGGSEEYKRQRRAVDQATRQINLLRNEVGGSVELGEFYPYRYLAAEGFLPGYNFTRLPLRIYLPTGETGGDFISRPRAIALREFGPLNIIYHNGRKYRVSQLIAQEIEGALGRAKISTEAGYYLEGGQYDLELCPFSQRNLGDNANVAYLSPLLEMSESRADEVERISCAEEERLSRGYEINTYFSVDGGALASVQKAFVRTDQRTLLNLRYIPAARLVHVSTKWRREDSDGFPIGLVSGDWRSSLPEPDSQMREPFQLVKLKTSQVADALYVEPLQALGLTREGVITLQYALKRAVELCFQVEPNEIGVISVGNREAPNLLLFEAAEGSLGILARFTADPAIFPAVVAEAIAICRYDDPAYKGPASYDDLLSYYNQRDHKFIDRHLIRNALEKLRLGAVEVQASNRYANYEAQYAALLAAMDPNSSTERRLLDYLYRNGLRLPDAAQKSVDGLYVRPDFYYEPRFWVFCDGTPHDDPQVARADEARRQAIFARGDEVWVYNYREDLAAAVAQRPDIFRKVR